MSDIGKYLNILVITCTFNYLFHLIADIIDKPFLSLHLKYFMILNTNNLLGELI